MHWRRCLDARNLILFNSINQLLDGLLQEFDFVHFGLLVLFDPGFDGEQSRLVELLGLDEHVDPELLLPLQVLDDGLVVDQVLLVFREVLGAHVLDFLDFGVVLEVDVVVALVGLLSRGAHFVDSLFVFGDNIVGESGVDLLHFAGDYADLLGKFGLERCFLVLNRRIDERNAVIEFSLFDVEFILRFFFIDFGSLLQFGNLNLNSLLKVLDLIVFHTMTFNLFIIMKNSFVMLRKLLFKVNNLVIELLEKVAMLHV
jgi:hypothetical protein